MTPLLPNRRFAGLWAATSISSFGTLMGALSLTALVYLDASAAQMGLLAAAGSAPVLLLSLAAGVWIDRVAKGPVLVLSDFGRFLALISVPAVAALGELHIEQVYAVAFCVGALNVLFELAYHAVLPAIVPADHLVDANSRLRMSEAVAEGVAPAAGGAIVQVFSGPAAVAVDAATFLASGVIVARVDWPRTEAPTGAPRSMLNEARQGIRTLLHHPLLRPLFANVATFNFFGGFFAALYSVWVIRELDLSPVALGVLVGAGGVGSIAGSFLSSRATRRFGLGRALTVSFMLTAAFQLMVPLAGGPAIAAFGLLFAVQLLGDPLWTIYIIGDTSLRQSVTPPDQLGRVNSCFVLASQGLQPLGALIAGLAAASVGVQETLLIGALGINAAGLWLVFSPIRGLKEPSFRA